MEDRSDSELVAGLRAGDPLAFDRAYEKYRARLYSFLARLTGRRDVAEDLLQETWLRLARHAMGLAPETNLGAWLYTVARNLFVSQRRWLLLDADRLRTLRLWPQSFTRSPFDELAATETERCAETALAALPLPYREALLLVVVERLEPAEAARILDIKPEALRQRLARARAMIKRSLEDGERKEAQPA